MTRVIWLITPACHFTSLSAPHSRIRSFTSTRMNSTSVDTAITNALNLDPATTTLKPLGKARLVSFFHLQGTLTNQTTSNTSSSSYSSVKAPRRRNFFVKLGNGAAVRDAFEGEHQSLTAIHAVDPTLCPESYAYGPLSSSFNDDEQERYFLATDFIHFQGSSSSSTPPVGSPTLARKLAKLHTTPAAAGLGGNETESPRFGFPVPTFCGDTEQPNDWHATWADFFAENRLRAISRAITATQGGGRAGDIERTIERVAAVVVPRLLGPDRLKGVVPVLVHGDLWSGNHGRGVLDSTAGEEKEGKMGAQELIYDPSAVYGHSEYELGIMKLFGGYDSKFWSEYLELVPKSEPVEEWDDRLALYMLYHQLNHYALFGGGYGPNAMSTMKQLIAKYGK